MIVCTTEVLGLVKPVHDRDAVADLDFDTKSHSFGHIPQEYDEFAPPKAF